MVEYPRLRKDFSPDAPQNVAVLKFPSMLFNPTIPMGASSRSEEYALKKCASRCVMILSSEGVRICFPFPKSSHWYFFFSLSQHAAIYMISVEWRGSILIVLHRCVSAVHPDGHGLQILTH